MHFLRALRRQRHQPKGMGHSVEWPIGDVVRHSGAIQARLIYSANA
jgi:hypothetical protein